MTMSTRVTSVALVVAASALIGCASDSSKEYAVHVPLPVLKTVVETESSAVIVTYKQENNRVSTRTVTAEGSYDGSEDSSISEIRDKAIEAMIKSAADQVNGQLISNSINVRQTQVGSGHFEETRRDVISQTVGFGKPLGKPTCTQTSLGTSMTCSGKVVVPLIDAVIIERKEIDG